MTTVSPKEKRKSVAGEIKSCRRREMQSFEVCACCQQIPPLLYLLLEFFLRFFILFPSTDTFRRCESACYFKSGIVFIVNVSFQYSGL